MDLPDINQLMVALPDGSAGEDLEYDHQYMEMDELAVAVPDQEIAGSVKEGREPDYRTLIKRAQSLWGRTRDLRVATYYAIAAFALSGPQGLRDGLKLIDYLVSGDWENFYPKLDPDDDNDPTERINILSMLSPQSGSYNDPIDLIGKIRQSRLTPELSCTLRDLLVAQGMLESSGDKPDQMLIDGQFRALPAETTDALLEVWQEINALLEQIAATVNDKVGDAGYVDFAVLKKEIKPLLGFLQRIHELGGGDAAAEAEAEDSETLESQEAAAAPAAPKAATRALDVHSLVITNRADALLLIRKSAEYFRNTEPSSPLPYLLERALRMSQMNFVEILTEIDRDTLGKVREQLGVIDNPEEN